MKKASFAFVPALTIAVLVLVLPLAVHAQNREKFVISARAGGVNAVTGRASLRHGDTEWQQLTNKEDLEAGDVVKTGVDGRVEMLLNPGSYLRIGENSEFELADNSLENLEVRLVRGTAIVEVAGLGDEPLFIGITTPHAHMSIIRRGLYRVSVVPGNATELIVRKGRVMLEDSHTKINSGNKVVFSGNSFSVAKLRNEQKDDLDSWSKDRAQYLAQENNSLSRKTLLGLASSFSYDWLPSARTGFWIYNPRNHCYTFVSSTGEYVSPYGGYYTGFGSLWGCGDCRQGWSTAVTPGYSTPGYPTSVPTTNSGFGRGSGSGSGSSGGSSMGSGSGSLSPTGRKPDISAGDGTGIRVPNRE